MNKFYYQELAERFLEKVAEGKAPFIRHAYREHTPARLESIENPIGTLKFDGANFGIRVDKEGKLSFVSRRLSVKGNEIVRTASLPHLANIRLPEFAGTIINAELIHNGYNKDAQESHNKVSGILNSLPERAIRVQKETGPVRAVLFDVLEPKLNTYKEKLEYLKRMEKAAKRPDIFFVPKVAYGIPEINNLLEESKKKGHEGVVITSLTKPESENPRYKAKHYQTYNLKVVGMTEAIDITGRPKGEMGALISADRDGRIVANVGSGFSSEQRKEMWKNPEKIKGQIIQVKTFGFVTNRLRAPIFNGYSDTNTADKVP